MAKTGFWFFLLCGGLALAACEFPGRPDQPAAPSPAASPAAITDRAQPPATPATAAPATATPPLPTPPPTVAPPPTPTLDPDLPDWTMLVYMAADNNLAPAAWQDLQEMEAAAGSEQVQVVVQLDAPPADDTAAAAAARRYQVRPDQDTAAVGSELLDELGPVNMGAGATLADFVAWGLRAYPANRVALLLWDHGAGWSGLAFDDGGDDAAAAVTDALTLPELATGLADGLAAAGRDRLDVLVFDACLMGQLELFAAVQPFARYAVGSQELTPGAGWNYQAVLSGLAASPDQDGAALAGQMVEDFGRAFRATAAGDFITMTAVGLDQIPALSQAVEQLAAALLTNPALAAGAVADARSGAESFARSAGENGDRYGAMDLGHFATVLAQRAPGEQVPAAARQVVAAVADAVLAHTRGPGLPHSQGIAVYFPRHQALYAPGYGAATSLATWNRFLNSYYDVGLGSLPPPAINLVSNLRSAVSVHQPAYLEFEVIGRSIDQVALVAGHQDADGRRRLLEFDHLIPEATILADGSRWRTWRDGLHEDFYIWDTQVTYLYDAAGAGGFVVMWPAGGSDGGTRRFAVQGRFRRAGATLYAPASITFDHRRGAMGAVWVGAGGGPAAPGQPLAGAAEIAPAPGDTFQVTNYYLDDAQQVVTEPGGSLVFDDRGQLYYDWRPLPDGPYFLGFAAGNAAGTSTFELTDLTVTNGANGLDRRAYLDPYLGFQFQYPANWYTPVYTGSLLYTTNPSATTVLQVTAFPALDTGVDAAVLKTEALARFGAVDVLFEDELVVAGTRALRTAYGYQRADGSQRTGVFVTFERDRVGYVLDVDGPAADEGHTMATVTGVVGSWEFTAAAFGRQPGQWDRLDLAAFSIPRPTDFTYQPTRDWQRFSANRDTFVALRVQPTSRPEGDVLAALTRDAGSGVVDFQAEAPRPFALGTAAWQRVDFSYRSGEQVIWGFVMVRVVGGQEIVAWAEAPRAVYNQLENSVFYVMIGALALPALP